ncbi:MAG: hypothetical protein IJY01_03715 [Clostridia bacterium]|nr:hypothetical protein [Clostridia bacterium]
MIDFEKYNVSEEDREFIQDMRDAVAPDSQTPMNLQCGDYGFHVDIANMELEIWHNSVMVAKYKSVDDMLINFKVNGIPLIEQIEKLDWR